MICSLNTRGVYRTVQLEELSVAPALCIMHLIIRGAQSPVELVRGDAAVNKPNWADVTGQRQYSHLFPLAPTDKTYEV